MRVAIFIAILLLAYCLSAEAGWWRRRRRSSRRTVNVGVRTGNEVPSATGTWTHESGNFKGSVTGTVDGNGNWGAGATGTWTFKKRSVELGGFNVTLQVDQCSFKTYDDNRDGEITVDEFLDIFGISEKASDLFDALDSSPENDIITLEEFLENAPETINGCAEVE